MIALGHIPKIEWTKETALGRNEKPKHSQAKHIDDATIPYKVYNRRYGA